MPLIPNRAGGIQTNVYQQSKVIAASLEAAEQSLNLQQSSATREFHNSPPSFAPPKSDLPHTHLIFIFSA